MNEKRHCTRKKKLATEEAKTRLEHKISLRIQREFKKYPADEHILDSSSKLENPIAGKNIGKCGNECEVAINSLKSKLELDIGDAKNRQIELEKLITENNDKITTIIKATLDRIDTLTQQIIPNKPIGKCSEPPKEILHQDSCEIQFSFVIDLSLESAKELFRVRNVQADGNCFYRALSVFLFQSEDRHQELRKEISSYGITNFQNMCHEGQDPSDVLNNFYLQAIEGIYAEGEIYQAAAEVLNCPLVIWTEFQRFPFVLLPKQIMSRSEDCRVVGLILESLHFRLFEITCVLDTIKIESERTPCLLRSKMSFISRSKAKKSTFTEIYTYLKSQSLSNPIYPQFIRTNQKNPNIDRKVWIKQINNFKHSYRSFFIQQPCVESLSKSELCKKTKCGSKQIPYEQEVGDIIKATHIRNNMHLNQFEQVTMIKASFIWDNIPHTVKQFQDKCIDCVMKQMLSTRQSLVGVAKHILSNNPLERVQIDLVSIPKIFHSKYKYLMTSRTIFRGWLKYT